MVIERGASSAKKKKKKRFIVEMKLLNSFYHKVPWQREKPGGCFVQMKVLDFHEASDQ